MKITHFISSPASGGAEVYVKDLSIEKVNLGHSVHILFLSNASDIGRDKLYEGEFLTDLSRAGVSYSFIGNKARRNLLFGIKALNKHILDFRPDILHCHLYYALFFSIFTKKCSVIYTHHSINHSLAFPKIVYRIFDFRVSAYIGICHACTRMLRGNTNNKVVKIDNAVSTERLLVKDFDEKIHVDNMKVKVLMVGRITQQKNYNFIFEVVDLLPDLNFEINIAGEGPDFDWLEEQIMSRKVGDKIKLLGNVSDIPMVMNRSDIFVMTSKWEGLPISLIEASLTGLPTIVTNVGGCAEISHECLNGFVVDSFSVSDYADKLRILIESNELRRTLGKNALAFSSNYKLVTAVSKHINLYDEV